jgi:PPK2 family polyphosphate:nucleotide phosphotransferase
VSLPLDVLDQLRVAPGTAADLSARDSAWPPRGSSQTAKPDRSGGAGRRSEHAAELAQLTTRLDAAQELLYASGAGPLLVVLQGMDASGKDGTIKHVLSGVNPQGCEVTSFKTPTAEELEHDFLWRSVRALPRRGRIGIFNRSYYEDVVVVRVHPEMLAPRLRRKGSGPEQKLWQQRFDTINAFEHHLHREGTQIVKLFLHLSKAEQARRLLQRLDDPAKLWKFSASDVAERDHWPAYQQAYEDAITATSTRWAPWYVVPADRKPAMRTLVATILVQTIEAMNLHVPEVGPETLAAVEQAKVRLLKE